MTSMKNVQFLHPRPSLFLLLVRIGKNWARPPAPGRRNFGYQLPTPAPPPPSPPTHTHTPISFGIYAAYRLYLNVSITYHARATHNSLQLKINLN